MPERPWAVATVAAALPVDQRVLAIQGCRAC
jgi:hypothetical protein